MFNSAAPFPVNILFYPDYTEFNPYQGMLYRALGPTMVATPVPDFEQLVADADTPVAGQILHLHWETAPIVQDGLKPAAFLDALARFRDLGGRIVWTMHNLMPHEPRHRAMAEQIRNGLLTLVDIVHVHSLPALAAAMELHALPLGKVRIIPHGNYDGAYPIIARSAARATLGLDDAQTVLLLPGQIRGYKAPAALAEAFVKVAGADDRLILAGHRMSDVTEESIPDDPRIIAKFGFSTAEDLARMYAAADIVVLPYTNSLTSGSAILAQTLGRGVLGSDTPGLRDAVLVPSTGMLFDPKTPDALATAVQAALAEGPAPWAARGQAAAQAARARDWAVIGASWHALFDELANLPRPARVLG